MVLYVVVLCVVPSSKSVYERFLARFQAVADDTIIGKLDMAMDMKTSRNAQSVERFAPVNPGLLIVIMSVAICALGRVLLTDSILM